jgi:diguanylate cyclase (GGDEF)-like protein
VQLLCGQPGRVRSIAQLMSQTRNGSNRPFTCPSKVSLDFDHFSHVNDRYGHAAGDAVLTELVKRIQGCQVFPPGPAELTSCMAVV